MTKIFKLQLDGIRFIKSTEEDLYQKVNKEFSLTYEDFIMLQQYGNISEVPEIQKNSA